jgi:RNA polymerase sigma-70 factor (ECF subfamily)
VEQETEDDALMLRLQQGDTTALAPLYTRHRGVVNAVVRRQVTAISESDAEDLCHEVFLDLVKLAPKYRHGSSLRGWLCGIALRKAWRRSRGEWVRRSLLGRFGARDGDELSESSGARVEASQQVKRLLAHLPPAMREVVVLCLVEQLDTEEVAAALGVSVNTVWTRLHRARERLKELEEELS